MKKIIWGSEAMALAVDLSGAKYALLSGTLNRTEKVTDLVKNVSGRIRVGTCIDTDAMLRIALQMSEAGDRTACFISSSDSVSYHSDMDRKIKSGFVYIVIENGSTAHVRGYSLTERLSLFIPTKVSELCTMIRDAFDYSELMHIPAMVYVSASLIGSSETVVYHNMLPAGINLNDDSNERKRLILTRIAGKYFRMKGKGKTAIIAIGEICGILEETICDINEIRFIQIKRILPWPEEILKRALTGVERIIIVVRKNEAVAEALASDYETVIVGASDSPESVIAAVKEAIGIESEKYFGYTDISDLRPHRRVPTLPDSGMKMCPGCTFRQELMELIEKSDRRKVVLEKVFCGRYMTLVNSGIQRGDTVFATDESDLYHKTQIERFGMPILYERRGGMDCIMFRNNSQKNISKLSINHVICVDCGKCVNYTGCPALWKRAFKVHLDRSKCTECGMCLSKCERRAICTI